MPRLNYGARHAKSYEYDKTAMAAAARADANLTADAWATCERHSGDALHAATGPRYDSTDGVDVTALKRLDTAVCGRDARAAMRACADVLSGRMHPTARSTIGGHIRQIVYTLSGHTRKAHEFEVSD